MKIVASTLCDSYKLGHKDMYPDGTQRVYSNWTPRGSRIPDVNEVVFFGLQAFLKKYLNPHALFDRKFFAKNRHSAAVQYSDRVNRYLGRTDTSAKHIEELWDIGYIPLEFRALPEGTLTPLRVPMFTVENTLPNFFWLTNYIESLLSCEIWQPCTSATLAHRMRVLLNGWAKKTGGDPNFVPWQGHDFSFRGMPGLEAAMASGAAHLLSFTGSDTIPAIDWIEEYYPGNPEDEILAMSVPASEHSVMCVGGQEGEIETLERLLDKFPTGILSVVSDTWDIWKLLTEYLPKLKDKILARNGKLVIRPDSGDPADIVCGTNRDFCGSDIPAERGVVELLWHEFGGASNSKGFRELNPHIGVIYGDSITYDRANEISQRLADKDFASTNIVYGIGSYWYQFQTRDTFGFAMKATHAVVNGEGRDLFKKPVTDTGEKFSATGRLSVQRAINTGKLFCIERATPEQEAASLLTPVWRDGVMLREQSFSDIRKLLAAQRDDK